MTAKLFAGCALALTLAVAPAARAADEKDIVETAVSTGKHDTFATAVKEAGLVEALKGKGPFTVFAPTDEAFAKLGDETIKAVLADKKLLRSILMAHVVKGKAVTAADVKAMAGKTVNGFTITTDDGVMIGDAKVVTADVKCSNGVIHVIDAVLVPAAKE